MVQQTKHGFLGAIRSANLHIALKAMLLFVLWCFFFLFSL